MTRRGGLTLAVVLVVGTTVALALLGGGPDGAGAEELDPLAPSALEVLAGVGAVLLVLLLVHVAIRLLARRR